MSCDGILLSKFPGCMRFQKAITYLSHSKCAIHAGRKFLCNNKTICSFNNLVRLLEPEEKRSGMQNILIVFLLIPLKSLVHDFLVEIFLTLWLHYLRLNCKGSLKKITSPSKSCFRITLSAWMMFLTFFFWFAKVIENPLKTFITKITTNKLNSIYEMEDSIIFVTDHYL